MEEDTMTHTLPELGYAFDALEPHLDAQTMEIHHDKHHAGYVKKLNAALEGHAGLQDKTVEELMKELESLPDDVKKAVQNNGGGHANHSFFWPLLKTGVEASGEVVEAITAEFESLDAFKDKFSQAAATVFGSGWAWLVVNKEGKLEVMKTANQDSPLTQGCTPLLGLDVWEHGYYKKWGPDRPGYIAAWWNVVNWNKVNEHFVKAK
jgi:superoxide dismutase, Fe-Mn family